MSDTSNAGSRPEETTFPVFMIHSNFGLQVLDDTLSQHGKVGFLRVVRDHNGRDTPLTIGILEESAYQSLCNAGLNVRKSDSDLWVTRYFLKDADLPPPERKHTLFVPVPTSVIDDEREVFNEITNKLHHLQQWNILPPDSWKIRIPLKSREFGGIRTGCFISFPGVDVRRIAMARVIMNDTRWSFEQNGYGLAFKCSWARPHNKQPRKDTDKPKKASKKKTEPKPSVSESGPPVPNLGQPTLMAPTIPIDTQEMAPTVPIPQPAKESEPAKEFEPAKESEPAPVQENKIIEQQRLEQLQQEAVIKQQEDEAILKHYHEQDLYKQQQEALRQQEQLRRQQEAAYIERQEELRDQQEKAALKQQQEEALRKQQEAALKQQQEQEQLRKEREAAYLLKQQQQSYVQIPSVDNTPAPPVRYEESAPIPVTPIITGNIPVPRTSPPASMRFAPQ